PRRLRRHSPARVREQPRRCGPARRDARAGALRRPVNTTRQCPKCGTALAPVLAGAVNVDGCPTCGGLLFDARGLARLAHGPRSEMEALERQFQSSAAETADAGPLQSRLCPACRAGMRTFEYPWAPGIRLEGCPSCHGVWIDDGELRRIEGTLEKWR